MQVSQFKQYSPAQSIGVITMYCNLYGVPLSEVTLPSVRNSISGLQLQSVFQYVQHKWLENTTGRLWDAEAFTDLSLYVSRWIDELPQQCENGTEWEYWWACQWKMAAQRVLGLNVKGDVT